MCVGVGVGVCRMADALCFDDESEMYTAFGQANIAQPGRLAKKQAGRPRDMSS